MDRMPSRGYGYPGGGYSPMMGQQSQYQRPQYSPRGMGGMGGMGGPALQAGAPAALMAAPAPQDYFGPPTADGQ